MKECFQMFQYLLATNSIDFMAGDFNYDLLKAPQKNVQIHLQTMSRW